MFKESSYLIRVGLVVVDLFLLFAALFLGHFFLSSLLHRGLGPFLRFLFLYWISAPAVVASLFYFRAYGPLSATRPMLLARRVLEGMVAAGVISAAVLFLTKSTYFSRLLFGVYFVIALAFMLADRLALYWLRLQVLRRGRGVRKVVVIGQGRKLEELLSFLERNPAVGLVVTRVMPLSANTEQELEKLLRKEPVDEVHIAFSRERCGAEVGKLLKLAEEYGKTIRVFINLDEELRWSRLSVFRFGSLPGLIFSSKVIDPDLMLVKRAMDVVMALVGLAVTAIMFPLVALAIKLDSPGPIIFAQERVGLNGRRFCLYKFRTMFVDAEERKRELMEKNEMDGPIFKLQRDPRVTRVGRWLRKLSIDEFPQFWNVLKGDMSIVGTRPPTPDEVERYQAWHYRRISIKPGITGLWQVSGRNKIKNFDDIVQLDLEYITNWSLWLDMKIIAKTIVVLLVPGRSGAC